MIGRGLAVGATAGGVSGMADHSTMRRGNAGGGARAAVYWQGGDPRWQPRDLVPLTTTEYADVCVVGGGFTGLWTALFIKRLAPGTDVVLVEREYCGAGASGRNGGWVNGWDGCPAQAHRAVRPGRGVVAARRLTAQCRRASAIPCETATSTATSRWRAA